MDLFDIRIKIAVQLCEPWCWYLFANIIQWWCSCITYWYSKPIGNTYLLHPSTKRPLKFHGMAIFYWSLVNHLERSHWYISVKLLSINDANWIHHYQFNITFQLQFFLICANTFPVGCMLVCVHILYSCGALVNSVLLLCM